MKRILSATIVCVALLYSATAFAGTEEDLRFIEALSARKWYDWALEVAEDIVDSSRTNRSIRSRAAEMQCLILEAQARETNDESLRQRALALRTKYTRMFSDQPEWGGFGRRFADLQRELQNAQDLGNAAEIEVNPQRRTELVAKAVKIFEDLASKWETLIKELREEVAKRPPEEKWRQLRKGLSAKEWDDFLQMVWFRDYGEYLYAMSFVYYAKVVSKEKKAQIIARGLKKFDRFMNGEPEHDKDYDPPCKGQEGHQEPNPRTFFEMLTYMAEIGMGQCYLELGNHARAIDSFDYMVKSELPYGSEARKDDLEKIVDIRLQAFYYEGLAYNLSNKSGDAEMILREMLAQSGREIQPGRGKVIDRDPETGERYSPPLSIKGYWEKKKQPQVAFMPNVRKHPYGKMAAFQLAKALTAQGRYSEGIEEAYKIFAIEQASRKGGQVSPFEVTAATTIADLAKQVSDMKFAIGPAFALAKGYYYKQQWDEAIYAFKKVYASPGTREAVREYAPKALFELGKLLYGEERHDEAAIAFAEICTQFRDFVQVGQAAKLLQQSASKARQAARKSGKFGKFDEELYKKYHRVSQEAVPRGIASLEEMLKLGGELSAEGSYELAAEKYAEIPKTYTERLSDGTKAVNAVPFYAQARGHVGYCHYRLFERKKKSNPKEAMEHLEEAISILEDALDEAAQAEDVATEVFARYYLGKCLTEDVWKGKDAEDKAKKTLTHTAPFKDKFERQKQAKKYAAKYAAKVLAIRARAYYKLTSYLKMHAEFLELEKKHKKSPDLAAAGFEFYGLMREKGDILAKEDIKLAERYYEKAAHYIYAWFKASEGKLSADSLLWAGGALSDTKSHKHAVEVLDKFFGKLSEPDKRTKKQKQDALTAKVLLGESRFGMEDYKGAAALFDILRRVVACETCGYQKILKPEDFDKIPEPCPNCKNEKIRLKKTYDAVLPIQEGAAKSHMAVFIQSGKKDFQALNKAQDVYQRILKRLEPTGELQKKYYEVLYKVVLCWYYKRDFSRIVGDLKTMILLSGPNVVDPENPSEEDWKNTIPVQPWRDKVRGLFEASLKITKKGRK